MGPLRKFRILFWPTAASAAVIGLLCVFEREQMEPQEPPVVRSASTRPMPRPWTIADDERQPGPRVAWTGPSLSREPFSRQELSYPFPPAGPVDSVVQPQKPLDIPIVQKPSYDHPVVIETLDPSADLAAPPAAALAFSGHHAPSVLLTDQVDQGVVEAALDSTLSSDPFDDMPLATLSAPEINVKDELAGLPDPQAFDDPFAGLHFSSNRIDPHPPAVETPASPAAAPAPSADVVTSPMARTPVTQQPSEWPKTPALDAQLSIVQELSPQGAEWSQRVRDTLSRLREQPKLGTVESGELIDQLNFLADQGYHMVNEDDLSIHRNWVATAYAVERRADIWHAVWNNMYAAEIGDRQPRPEAKANVLQLVAELREQVIQTRDTADWQRFLMLDEIESASLGNTTDAERRLIAQRFLSRVEYTELSEAQSEWLHKSACRQLGETIRSWAHGPVDYVALLDQIEVQETDTLDRDGGRVAATMQTLRFANNAHAYAIAEAINRHYRNANLRVSISAAMLNRLLPEVPAKTQPIRDRVLGASVLGTSHATAELQVHLEPSENAWQIRLRSLGKIDTKTWSRQGPAQLKHVGNANFVAGALIRVDRGGVDIESPDVDVDADNQLRRVRTEYDGFPVLGPLVREYVKQRHDEARSYAQRYSERRMRSQIETELAESLQKQIDEAEKTFSSRLIGPLAALDLSPTVVDLSTTEDRLTARYRLSGDWQLASFTPRPRAPTECMMSVQMHQSTLNNAMARLAPQGEPVLVDAAIRETLQVFGFEGRKATEELPDNVMIQFTSSRPVTVEIHDGRLDLTMRIIRLDQTDGITLRNFIVKASYIPHIDGLRPALVRDGHLNISGPRLSMGDRVAVRAIFNKVLSPNRSLELTSEQLRSHPAMDGLAITQFELRDGWIGFAIGDEVNYMAEAALYSQPAKR
ncbi:hypothetical protein Poly24_16580 [Rosistilla carotiformis]|uniref:Uncharacterized protein n=1 Tax=Rosistilla carotiformis TaxID=2528017 RepID=A0A518JQY8_9BACT|nr:hypothetical protein [Rosistilla carotiformis]QDV67952.1 hypothetical protein Poly24_16580 [Rosistilla carotiformis]